MGNGNGKNPTIFIANKTGKKIQVLLSPSGNFPLKKLFARNDPVLADLEKKSIYSVGDLWAVWNKMEPTQDNSDTIVKVKTLFNRFGIEILPQTACDIYDTSLSEPLDYLSAYGWGKMCTGSDACVSICVDESEDSMKLAHFQTLEDWSWIAHEDYVTLSKKDTLWDNALDSGHKMVKRKMNKE